MSKKTKKKQAKEKVTAEEAKREAIQRLAHKIYIKGTSYDECVWLLAEARLMEETGIQPDEATVRKAAEQMYQQHVPLQDLHWLLAEKQAGTDR
ncbi:MAG: hypothetical protein ACFFD4_35550 [Candidatus Odinarchaeota archaeon]